MTAPPKNAIITVKNRGAGRLRGSDASTLLPDVDNATVGSFHESFRRRIPTWVSAVFDFLDREERGEENITGVPGFRERAEGERPGPGPYGSRRHAGALLTAMGSRVPA